MLMCMHERHLLGAVWRLQRAFYEQKMRAFAPVDDQTGARQVATIFNAEMDSSGSAIGDEYRCCLYHVSADWEVNPFQSCLVYYYEFDLQGRPQLMLIQTDTKLSPWDISEAVSSTDGCVCNHY